MLTKLAYVAIRMHPPPRPDLATQMAWSQFYLFKRKYHQIRREYGGRPLYVICCDTKGVRLGFPVVKQLCGLADWLVLSVCVPCYS